MRQKSNCTVEDVVRLLREGHGVKETIKRLHIAYSSPKVIEAMRRMRRGGEPVTKPECVKGKNKPTFNMERINRATKKGWVKYMMANPGYFTSIFSKEGTKLNILEEADRQFKEAVCKCCGKVHNYIQCMPDFVEEDNSFTLSVHTNGLYATKNSLSQ